MPLRPTLTENIDTLNMTSLIAFYDVFSTPDRYVETIPETKENTQTELVQYHSDFNIYIFDQLRMDTCA